MEIKPEADQEPEERRIEIGNDTHMDENQNDGRDE